MKYKETVISLMIWTLIVYQQLQSSMDRIIQLTEITRKKKTACAVNSLITSILTIATFISLLLIDTRAYQQTSYQEILWILFGCALQLLALVGNVYSIVCFVRKYKTFKSEINMVLKTTQAHFACVCEVNDELVVDRQTKFILQHVSLDGFSTLHNVTFLTIFSAQLTIRFVRIFSIGLRFVVVIALIGSVLCIPLDIVEIVHFMRSRSRPSKLVKRFNEFSKDVMKKVHDVINEALDKSIEELSQEEQQRKEERLLACAVTDGPGKLLSELPFES